MDRCTRFTGNQRWKTVPVVFCADGVYRGTAQITPGGLDVVILDAVARNARTSRSRAGRRVEPPKIRRPHQQDVPSGGRGSPSSKRATSSKKDGRRGVRRVPCSRRDSRHARPNRRGGTDHPWGKPMMFQGGKESRPRISKSSPGERRRGRAV